jgi:hypothetical protein
MGTPHVSSPLVAVPCRRRTMRLPATWDVWVYWESGHLRDVSHVRDLSPAGMFLETSRCRPKGDSTRIHFLVPEGEIYLDGVVARAESGTGLGLKFKSINSEAIPQLTALINRLRPASPVAGESWRPPDPDM